MEHNVAQHFSSIFRSTSAFFSREHEEAVFLHSNFCFFVGGRQVDSALIHSPISSLSRFMISHVSLFSWATHIVVPIGNCLTWTALHQRCWISDPLGGHRRWCCACFRVKIEGVSSVSASSSRIGCCCEVSSFSRRGWSIIVVGPGPSFIVADWHLHRRLSDNV